MKDEIDAKEYFNYLKDKAQNITKNDLANFYKGCLALLDKYEITGQKRIIDKMVFLIECVSKEKKIIDKGINSFVYRDEIENYIDVISKNVVKIIELENYPRDIPDDIVKKISETKDIFDKMYVVFTDYTGEIERTVNKERRDKDPILFGTFQKNISDNSREVLINDRFYYIGDWEDEYCDLTMDKFLNEVGKEKLQKISVPTTTKEIEKELNMLDDQFRRRNNIHNKKGNIFKRLFNKIKK